MTGPREASDNYRDIAVPINDNWRVIRCQYQRQWVLQNRLNSQWSNRIYTSCPQTLSEFVRDLIGHVDFDTERDIYTLPKGEAIAAWTPRRDIAGAPA